MLSIVSFALSPSLKLFVISLRLTAIASFINDNTIMATIIFKMIKAPRAIPKTIKPFSESFMTENDPITDTKNMMKPKMIKATANECTVACGWTLRLLRLPIILAPSTIAIIPHI